MKNWWYYHKWYVICTIILLGIAIHIIGNKFHLWEKTPDYEIAYIGTDALSEETVSAIEQAFAAISDDFNHDGQIIVKLNQYPTHTNLQSDEGTTYQYASEIALIGDIADCDSFFYLMENPDDIQKNYHILACPDGSCPDDNDYGINDKVISWKDSPFAADSLGTYSINILGEKINWHKSRFIKSSLSWYSMFLHRQNIKKFDRMSKIMAIYL